jgi:integrase
VLLALLYDTGARIQELLDLTPGDVRLVPPAVARLHGKGRRECLCTLLSQTARLVSRCVARVARPVDDRPPLFRNRHGQPLKRHCARYLLMKYLDRAHRSMASLRRSGISPHTIRHTPHEAILLGQRSAAQTVTTAGRGIHRRIGRTRLGWTMHAFGSADHFVGVGIAVTHDPLHRSGRAALPHPAPTLGDDAKPHERIGMADADGRKPAEAVLPHP